MAPEDFDTDGSSPAALIISGSGATDRDGNSSGLPLGTNRNLAITLAEAGIPSLRYDKVGSGETGLGSHTDPSTVDYSLYLQEAKDAADYLAQQPGVDPSKIILVGHSEGALFALALADELTKAGTPPAGLILAAPLSIRYLDLITEQLSTQLTAAVDGGQMGEDAAAEISDELASIVDSIRTTGELPETIEDPSLAQLFNAGTASFLSSIDPIDPAELAAGLPADLPVLVLLGAKDAQVTGDQVRHLLDGFDAAGNDNVTFVALPKADHTLRIIEGEADPAVDYTNPDLEFSPQAVSAIDAFLENTGLAGAEGHVSPCMG
jgi:acetyl esterase/lipase